MKQQSSSFVFLKKALFIFNLVLVTSIASNAQTGAKWSTGGNGIGTGDFIGSTNNFPVIFKVNNTPKMTLAASGVLQLNNLSGTDNRLLQTDASGNITSFPMGTASQVLYGNGTWGSLPTAGIWHASGSNIYYAGGNVGIGTSAPLFPLDVTGDVRISNNLYVGGGIVISDKVNAATQVTTGKMLADSIITDSTKGFFGTSKFNGAVKLQNKLDVTGPTVFNGSTLVNGSFTAAGNITFWGNKTISYTPATSSTPEIFGFATLPGTVALSPCLTGAPITTATQFNGLIQAIGTTGGAPTTVSMGFDGTGGILDVAGGGANTRLLVNYYCGKDVAICTGPSGGTLYAMKTHLGTGKPVGGSTHDDAMLSVDGKVVAKSVYVTQNDWADYVFAKNYKLPKLSEVEAYYKVNNHLPEIPSEKEITENGVNISEMNKLLLKKVEELTIYVVEQQKEIEELKLKTK